MDLLLEPNSRCRAAVRIIAPAAVATAIALLLVSCGSQSPAEPAGSTGGPGLDTGGSGSGADSGLECEIDAYPCSMSEVPREVLERSDALGDEALAMLEDGTSTTDAANWLNQQSDVLEVEWDDQAIRFRVDGGRSTWIFREPLFGTAGTSAPARASHSPSAPARHVVSEEKEQKKALVLSPFSWQVPGLEDGTPVSGILGNTRGYEGRVQFLANETKKQSNVNLSSFSGWGEYEVIHVTTHGKRLCDASGCRATILAGLLESALPGQEPWEQLLNLNQKGIDYVKGEKTGLEYVSLTADFFRSEYPMGLDDALIFFNACQSFGPQATDLIDAVQGSNSVVLGWSEAVYVEDATAAAVALYNELSEGGYPAMVALSNIGDLRTGQSIGEGHGTPELRLSERKGGGDLRIREVVYLLKPGTDQILTGSDKVSIDGTQGDGEPDAAPYLVRVDGIKEEYAASTMVHAAVDGVEADPVPLTSGTRNDRDQWTVSGLIPLPYDLQDETMVTFRGWANLHSGGESEHEMSATLTGEEPIMGNVWELEATHVTGYTGGIPHTPYTASAHLTLSFAEGQPADEPHPKYVVTGGSVTYDYSHTYYECTFSAPVVTFDVTAEHTGFSSLMFDTTVEPVQYSGILYTNGPEFEYVAVCTTFGDPDPTTYTHKANNVWLRVDDPDAQHTVSTDRSTITGTYLNTNEFPDGTAFFLESTYTIRRIR